MLEVFGHFRVGFSRDRSVVRLMVSEGAALVERLCNLDEVHARVKRVMPHLEPPSSEFEPGGEGLHRLYGHSAREGLQPMGIGRLHGRVAESGERVEIAHAARRDDGADHDMLELRMLDAAACMRSEARAGTVCARLGGDEFAMLFDGATDAAGLQAMATRLIAAMSQPLRIEGRITRIGASIGIAVVEPGRACTPDALLHEADLALYEINAAGAAPPCSARRSCAPVTPISRP